MLYNSYATKSNRYTRYVFFIKHTDKVNYRKAYVLEKKTQLYDYYFLFCLIHFMT